MGWPGCQGWLKPSGGPEQGFFWTDMPTPPQVPVLVERLEYNGRQNLSYSGGWNGWETFKQFGPITCSLNAWVGGKVVRRWRSAKSFCISYESLPISSLTSWDQPAQVPLAGCGGPRPPQRA